MNEINLTLNDGHARGTGKGPRKTSKAKAGRIGGLKTQASRRKKHSKAKFIDKLPKAAVNIKGVHTDYHYVPGVGVISLTKQGRIRLLTLPRKGGSWTVRTPRGKRFFLTRGRLTKGTGLEVTA